MEQLQIEKNNWQILSSKIQELKHALKFRPGFNHMSVEILYLAILVVMQQVIWPQWVGPYIVIDWVTPFLVMILVHHHATRSWLLLIITALLLEFHSQIPAGFYLTIYAMLFCVICLFRESISWRYVTPWVVFIVATTLLSVILQGACLFLAENTQRFSTDFFIQSMSKLTLTPLWAAIILAYYFSLNDEDRNLE